MPIVESNYDIYAKLAYIRSGSQLTPLDGGNSTSSFKPLKTKSRAFGCEKTWRASTKTPVSKDLYLETSRENTPPLKNMITDLKKVAAKKRRQ